MNSLDELILKWQEGRLSAGEMRQLNELLARSENRRILCDEFLLSAGLRNTSSRSIPSNVVPMASPRSTVKTFAWITAAAACVVFSAFIVRLAIRMPEAALLTESGQELKSGDIVETAEGEVAEIRADSGKSSIQLRGGSSVEILSAGRQKQFRLHRGSILGSVAPQREPMLIFTPQAEAIVLGTEFTLSALAHSTRLDVEHGKVRFKRMTDGRALEVRDHQFATMSPEASFAILPLPPAPWRDKDIGGVALHGAAFIEGGKCLIKGAGRNTCLKKDQLHFMYQGIRGDFDFRARLVSFSGTSDNARAGLMVRRSLQSACRQAFVAFRGDQRLEVQCRPQSESEEIFNTAAALPLWLRVSRQGTTLQFAISKDNAQWQQVACDSIGLGAEVLVGLAVTSFDNEVLDESVFDEISLNSSASGTL